MKITTDIDIDFADRDSVLSGLFHVPATIRKKYKNKHPSGVYFQDIPVDPIDGLAVLDYEDAGEQGYFKIDFLNNKVYSGIRDEDHLINLLNTEPYWELLEDSYVVEQLAHIHSSYGIVTKIRPKSIEDLAIVLALMRPAKKHLLGSSREEIDAEIWKVSNDGFQFKRSHAIAYAASIVVQLNLFCEQLAEKANDV